MDLCLGCQNWYKVNLGLRWDEKIGPDSHCHHKEMFRDDRIPPSILGSQYNPAVGIGSAIGMTPEFIKSINCSCHSYPTCGPFRRTLFKLEHDLPGLTELLFYSNFCPQCGRKLND
jgi:hypothetical protein